MAAEALVGRQVSVWWPDEAAWFAGTVAAHDTASGKHTACSHLHNTTCSSKIVLLLITGRVKAEDKVDIGDMGVHLRPPRNFWGKISLVQVTYVDGDVETLWLAAERVRLALAPGETLPPPAPSALRELACHLLAAARTADTG